MLLTALLYERWGHAIESYANLSDDRDEDGRPLDLELYRKAESLLMDVYAKLDRSSGIGRTSVAEPGPRA